MLVPYDDFFREFFEARGVAEEEGRAWLHIMECMMDEYVIEGLENSLGEDEGFDSDSMPPGVESGCSAKPKFNSAARDDAAGKKET
ncbi:hypothetical protein [Novosphingobium album (ex Liu et al. 2023)]|uniref:Uncharacterized protein n=1 Tax=Novosphingobium album (ex Liu et al. 2023) TaxID=3031130 RepID=A0ABT5WTV1_9SPHN|nr:hypothetical protein [Novosphingobium album (ex Liu et al. 2023)]MDE8653326.1 hypothetical protein [Novosphingobium album (ex Liu et al. 2023)]